MSSSAILKHAKAVAILAFLGVEAQLTYQQPELVATRSYPGSSNKFDAKSLKSSCSCDLTGGACDYACCCDTDCSKTIIEAWQDSGVCAASKSNSGSCGGNGAPSLADLNSSGDMFSSLISSILCSQSSNEGGGEETTYEPLSPKTYEELQPMLAPRDQLQSEPVFGYQPNEELANSDGKVSLNLPGMYGHCQPKAAQFMKDEPVQECMVKRVKQMDEALCSQLSASKIIKDKIYKGDANGTFKGQEIEVRPSSTQVKYNMDDLKEMPFNLPTEGQFAESSFSGGSCDNFVLEAHYKVFFTEVDPEKTSPAAPETQPPADPSSSTQDSSVNNADGQPSDGSSAGDNSNPPSTDNSSTPGRLLAAAKQSEQTPNSYFIDKVEVDVVYGKVTSSNEGFKLGNSKGERTFKLKSSVSFLESEYSRHKPGALGYETDKPILVGNLETLKHSETDPSNGAVTTTEKKAISYNLNGFALKGADYYGKCMFVNERINPDNDEKFSDLFPGQTAQMETVKTKMYLDDPVLPFIDSMVYGCSLEFTYDELKDFCDSSKKWTYLAIYQNMYQLSKIGISASSDPHYISDWIDSTIDSSKDKWVTDVSEFTEDGACSFPSVHMVEIISQKIGLQEDPQSLIYQLSHYQANMNSNWKFTLPDKSKKQRFDALVVINQAQLDQDVNLFVGDFQATESFTLSPNILYPFYVYGEVDQKGLN